MPIMTHVTAIGPDKLHLAFGYRDPRGFPVKAFTTLTNEEWDALVQQVADARRLQTSDRNCNV